jgi:hypothetical protein
MTKTTRLTDAHPVGFWKGGLLLTSSKAEAPYFLLELSEPDTPNFGMSIKAPEGLRLTRSRFQIEDRVTWAIRFEPVHESHSQVFASLVDFLCDELPKSDANGRPEEILDQQLSKWIEFSRTARFVISTNRMLGLVGELIAIRDVLDNLSFTAANWQGPTGAPQDFRGDKSALEVKVSSNRTGPLVHTISSIDQLGVSSDIQLHVLSLRAKFVSSGGESVHDLVNRVAGLESFASPIEQRIFWETMSRFGYSEALPAEVSRFEIFEQKLFEVRTGFPAITRQNTTLDSRIVQVSYNLDFSALGEYETKNLERNGFKLNWGR